MSKVVTRLEENVSIDDDKLMKLRSFFLLFLAYCHALFGLDIRIETPYAILMNAETGKVLYEKNARARISPASTMKIATVLYLLEKSGDQLDQMVRVAPAALKMTSEREKKLTNFSLPAHYLEPDGTMIYIKSGEVLSLKSLIFGALLKSGNDACNAIVYHFTEAASDEAKFERFSHDLNRWLKEKIGVQDTHFNNPHGLYHPDHYSCAYDMALIAKAAYENPLFMEFGLEKDHEKPKTNLQSSELWKSNCRLYHEDNEFYYSKLLFAKTGNLKIAKRNLVAVATNGERTLILALHKSDTSEQRYLDAIHMFETAFNEKKVKRPLLMKNDTSFEKQLLKANKPLIAMLDEDVFLEYFPSEEPKVKAELKWEESLKLPLKAGDIVAKIIIVDDKGNKLNSVPLYAKEAVKKKLSFIWLGSSLFIAGILMFLMWVLFKPLFQKAK